MVPKSLVSRNWVILTLFALLCALLNRPASAQALEANPSGDGYRLRFDFADHSEFGLSVIDLNSVTLKVHRFSYEARDDPYPYGAVIIPFRGQGDLKIDPNGTTVVAVPRLPTSFWSATEIDMKCRAFCDGLWQEKSFSVSTVIPDRVVKAPTDLPGQTFVIVPPEKLKVFSSPGKVAPTSTYLLKLLTYARVEHGVTAKYRYWFSVADGPTKVFVESDHPILEEPGIEPTASTVIYRASMVHFPAKRPVAPGKFPYGTFIVSNRVDQDAFDFKPYFERGAWVYASFITVMANTGKIGDKVNTGYRRLGVRLMVRLWRSRYVTPSLGYTDYEDGGFSPSWCGLHPILAVLDLPSEVHTTQDRVNGVQLVAPVVFAADIWHLNRLLSSHPPSADFAGASERVKHGLITLQPVKGMTYRQLAWAYGWPPDPVAINVLLSPPGHDWYYPAGPISTNSAVFKNGRMIDFAESQMP